jgi:hypothetical protein
MDKDFFHKVKIKEHEFIKEWFLDQYQDYLDELPLSPSKTDHQRNKKYQPPYGKEWEYFAKPYINEFCLKFGVNNYEYDYWTAQYDTNIDHHWHIHSGSHFGVVYYMELPYNENSTEFWKKKFPADEGEMIFFPSWWIHRSTPNLYNKQKTVIAGNLTFINHSFLPE